MVLSLVKRTPLHQLFVVTLVGIASGVYIYKPLLEKHVAKRNSKEKTDAVSSDGSAVSHDVNPSNTISSAATKTSTPAKKKDITGALLIQVKGKDHTASSSE